MLAAGAGARRAQQGKAEHLAAAEALKALEERPHLVCHATMLLNRLRQVAGANAATTAANATHGSSASSMAPRHFDVAALFAFVLPAVSVPPLPSSLGAVLGLDLSDDDPASLHALARALLALLAEGNCPAPGQAAGLARMLARGGWPWAEAVLQALGQTAQTSGEALFDVDALAAWKRLPEWEENPPQPPPGQQPVAAEEAVRELARILGPRAEERPDQRRYAAAVAEAFAPRPSRHENTILLAEAGTGLGKTLGYLSPAALWARRNAGAVWVATYTRNLQRQLLEETRRLWPEPALHRRRVSVRKGRENYLCLLNAEETLGQLAASGTQGMLLAALLARWLAATVDGDMVGGDFPAWLLPLLGGERLAQATPMSLGLTDRRGECTYTACRHFRKCFIEKARVRAERADVVIANHAVVLVAAAINVLLGETEPLKALQGVQPGRIVFDEGHHLFDAADSAFSGHLSMLEAAELRRWIRGAERSRRRGRGLRERLGDLLLPGQGGLDLLQQVEEAARILPAEGWRQRLQQHMPVGPAERFFLLVREQVLARNVRTQQGAQAAGRELEADCFPLNEGLAEAADALADALAVSQQGMARLSSLLLARLEAEAKTLTSAERSRLESLARGLIRRSELMLGGWRAMLRRLREKPAGGQNGGTREEQQAAGQADARTEAQAEAQVEDQDERIIMWFSIEHAFGQEHDIGLHAHWVDPTIPLAETVLKPADSVVITSATLRDSATDAENWRSAEMRTGAVHLPWVARRASFPSPFDYASNARIFVVSDLDRENMDQLAAAYRELFLATGGGALGLFTAISRLKAVHRRILPSLATAGLPLYAQHVDAMDTGTLVDIFRAQRDACLLGTDAVRDGIDVPGDSLRLLVMERVPWSRPTILERARQQAFGRQRWTDMQVRLRLRQAFGRLIRKADDRGVFVLLDNRLSSRFYPAFPPDVPIRRLRLAEAIAETRAFLHGNGT